MAWGSSAHVVIEVTVETQNVRVAQVGLDLYFPSQLMFYVGVTQLILEEHLGRQPALTSLAASGFSSLVMSKQQNTLPDEQAHLQSNDELGLPLPSKVDIPKLATPQGLANVKVSQLPPPVFVTAADRTPAACKRSCLCFTAGPDCLGCSLCWLSNSGWRWTHRLCRSCCSMLRLDISTVGRLQRRPDAGCLAELGLLFRWLQGTPVSWPFGLE